LHTNLPFRHQPRHLGADEMHEATEEHAMRKFLIVSAALVGLGGLAMAQNARAQTPAEQQPRPVAPGKVEAPTEAEPTRGSASAVTPILGHVDVHFGAGSASITEGERASLDRLAALCTQGQASTIVLVGHSDERGDPRRSLQLSLGRATAVMEALVARHDLSKVGWEISGVVAPDRESDPNRGVIGSCK
jgi:outer membrane protein OmpA-like peptidoglycan-associated protein